MAVYYCAECDSYKDGDYDPCGTHPESDTETICEDCAWEINEFNREKKLYERAKK